MEDLNKILRIQPKTRLEFDKESRTFSFEKSYRINYDRMGPLDSIQVESTLSELKRRTRHYWRRRDEQYLPASWIKNGFTKEEIQENFDEAVYEQQLTQRLGRGILTQQPQLEWVSLQEATEIFRVNYKVVNRWISEGKLTVLQHKKGHRKLIYLDQGFYNIELGNIKRTFEDNLDWILARIGILMFEAKTKRYRRWKFPQSPIERIYPILFTKESIRVHMKNLGDERLFKTLAKRVGNRELRKYRTAHISMDDDYFNALMARSRLIHVGRPPLRYFTTEEAAFYLRLTKLAIIKAVKAGRLTPFKTDTGKHFIFEKKQLLAFAGPSTNPFDLDERGKKTIEWVEANFFDEFKSLVPRLSRSRSFFTEAEKSFETWKIKKAFSRLCKVSLAYRAENLHFYKMLFPPEIKLPPNSRACTDIQSYTPQPKMRKRKVRNG